MIPEQSNKPQKGNVEWRVIYAEDDEHSGESKQMIALTGSKRRHVQWMYESLADKEKSPEVVWVRLERATWECVDHA